LATSAFRTLGFPGSGARHQSFFEALCLALLPEHKKNKTPTLPAGRQACPALVATFRQDFIGEATCHRAKDVRH
jgi:hypothetical protein